MLDLGVQIIIPLAEDTVVINIHLAERWRPDECDDESPTTSACTQKAWVVDSELTEPHVAGGQPIEHTGGGPKMTAETHFFFDR